MRHLITALFALLERSTQLLESFEKERLDIMRLQSACLSTLHVLTNATNSAGVHRIVSKRALFQKILQVRTVERALHCFREASTNVGSFAISDRIDEQFAESAALELQFTKHVKYLAAQRLSCLLQLLQ